LRDYTFLNAEFFIGANMKELVSAKQQIEQNRERVSELEQLMLQLDNDTDKLEVANKIITLQEDQLTLREQLTDIGSGFSLFGWISRWRWNF
jgi:type II secretory pathway component PulJ